MPTDTRKMLSDRIAFDYASVRRKDADGRLHVQQANISKSNVCPYYGYEIPGFARFGLDPDRVYKLLRDPVELAKAADTFNNIPLMQIHISQSAAEPN